MEKSSIKSSAILLAIIVSFFVGLNWNQDKVQIVEPSINNSEPQRVNFDIFWQAWNLIKKEYVDKVDEKDLVYGAVRGLVASLDDPYSLFMDPAESKQFAQDLEGSFEGIGAEIGMRDGALAIIAPLAGMPAEKAGLLAGDKIIKINGELTTGLTLNNAVRLIRGSRGTIVVLTILRSGKTKDVEITRSKIDVPSVTWELKRSRIAYIDIDNFSDDVNQEFTLALGQILPLKPRGLIVDLRNNPGGFLERAIDISSWWLSRGEIVVTERDGEDIVREHKSRGPGDLQNLQTVVLVNKGSASASEIVAGALRDQKNILLIGEKTFGKGSVQELKSLKDSSQLRLTIAKWFTPSGRSIHKQGLEPDIVVSLTMDDIKKKDDPQLDKAMEILLKTIDKHESYNKRRN